MKSFTRWLVDNGRRVRLFVGDTNNADETVVEKILADLRTHRPDLGPTWVVADPVVTFADLMQAMEPAGIWSPLVTTMWCARSCCPSPRSLSGTAKRTRC